MVMVVMPYVLFVSDVSLNTAGTILYDILVDQRLRSSKSSQCVNEEPSTISIGVLQCLF